MKVKGLKKVGEGVARHYEYKGHKIYKKCSTGMNSRGFIVRHIYFDAKGINAGSKLMDVVRVIDEMQKDDVANA